MSSEDILVHNMHFYSSEKVDGKVRQILDEALDRDRALHPHRKHISLHILLPLPQYTSPPVLIHCCLSNRSGCLPKNPPGFHMKL